MTTAEREQPADNPDDTHRRPGRPGFDEDEQPEHPIADPPKPEHPIAEPPPRRPGRPEHPIAPTPDPKGA